LDVGKFYKAVLSSYTLAVAVFVPVSGWMADRFGTRRVFSNAVALFTLGSLLCGLSTDIHMLVACRVLQGFGGAMMVPALIGPMLDPVIGGFIVHYLHWRSIFFVNFPIGLIGLYLIYRNLPDYRAEKSTPLDWVGLVMFSSGVALLSYVLEVFGEHMLGNY
jgi:MFS family permease